MPTTQALDILLLAAGSSSRLERPKQLLILNENTLLRHAAERALELTPNVTVVLGHESEKCRMALNMLPVTIAVNENYKEGIGNSIAFGVSQIDDHNGLLVMLCDQPLIPQRHYEGLIRAAASHPDLIIASCYNDKPGVPAVFPYKYRNALQQLSGDTGAKKLILTKPSLFIPLTEVEAKDIDTEEAWQEVNTLFSQSKS